MRRESVLFLFQELAPGEKVGSILYQCRVQWVAMSLALVQLAERETSKILPLVSNLSLSLDKWVGYFKGIRQVICKNLTITNWRLLWSLHMKPPRILGGHSEKTEAT